MRAGAVLFGLLFAMPAPLHPTSAGTSAEATLKAASPAAAARQQRRRPSYRGQLAPTPERIREIQSALAEAGFYQREPTGKWDAYSVEALKKFQEANGLKPTGKLDALSLQKLGLGSEIAGLAPPRLPAGKDGASGESRQTGTPD
jgi:peptidoglycan hydrolase-like protein with peptidoglycan-binding domain